MGAALVPRLSLLLPQFQSRWLQRLANGVDTVIPFLLTAVLEALLLCTLGTTPGKALMGLTLRRADGSKLSPAQALQRGALKFVWGEGLGISLLSAVAQIRSFDCSQSGKPLPWEKDYSYTMTQRSNGARLAAYFIPAAVILGLNLALGGLSGGA